MTDFELPASKLTRVVLGAQEVAAASSGRQGFSLDERASEPATAKSGRWQFEWVTISHDFTSLAAHLGESNTLTIPGLQLGDLCFYIGQNGSDQNSRINTVRDPLCTVKESTVIQTYNSGDVFNNPGANTLHFLVIHRFLTA